MLEESDKSKSLTRDIFSILSKEGALEILNETDSKLVSRRETHGDLGLTRRQYYSRLRELKNLGMIKKEGNGYIRTDEGEKIHKILNRVTDPKGKYWGGEETISIDDIYSGEPVPDGDKSKNLIVSYDELTDLLVKQIESSESEILIASRYVDHRVLRTLCDYEDQITTKLVIRKLNLLDSFEIFKAFMSKKEIKQLVEFISKNGRVSHKLPFSFFSKDRRKAGVEVVIPIKPDDFFFGILLDGEDICKEFQVLFNSLYEISEKINVRENATF